MRKALNDNPKVQMAVVGVLLLFGALFLLMRGGSGSSEPAAGTAPKAASVAPAGTATPTGTAAPATDASTSVALPAVDFQPGPGLPRPVFTAYESDNVVVLLVTRRGSTDDELVRSSVEALRGEPDVSVFVVPSRRASRYAAVTGALGVDRAPALVVLKPRRLSGGSPEGEVRYAFRSAESVRQAVRDARYEGPQHHGFDP